MNANRTSSSSAVPATSRYPQPFEHIEILFCLECSGFDSTVQFEKAH
jgi:hypothetical protein